MRCTYWLEVCAFVCVCVRFWIFHFIRIERACMWWAPSELACVCRAGSTMKCMPFQCEFKHTHEHHATNTHTHHRGLFHQTGDHFRWGMEKSHTHTPNIIYMSLFMVTLEWFILNAYTHVYVPIYVHITIAGELYHYACVIVRPMCVLYVGHNGRAREQIPFIAHNQTITISITIIIICNIWAIAQNGQKSHMFERPRDTTTAAARVAV